ncbi:tripartite tricarboxylate transporter TctB family protein [Oryzicola mucosus]|uniref:Tripartite tricarboxylate transporter TctB family protein n=1 Tax=Oryzicola mucosus TaxID=2767425 RepID=A0A8J6TYF9_9HYPH|nr:tripartite tricarboxylate transporter TctB family protein [Oryzicola mucosus]MBD0414311.1 tripartite tricarboxylate transporter TctB family protein [Oryzicola mucosus]
MKSFTIDPVNGACGAIFVALGGFFAFQSQQLDLGTTFRMGPGYFPLVLALVLVLLGLVVVVQATRIKGEPLGPIAWRGALFILPAPILFGVTVRGLGFVPSLFLTCLLASFASSRMTVPLALILSAVITAFSVAVFSYGLGLPFRNIGPWLSF